MRPAHGASSDEKSLASLIVRMTANASATKKLSAEGHGDWA
jgi:hypothetical protein